ncbi:MAG: KDO2-lipid IV(A) lauroyltransferase [Candidatus Azotimanducaceae bacterium]|jgi:KDO2-lipid IV(A) lauroyltransferase
MIKSFLYRAVISLTGHLPLPLLRALGHLIGTTLWLSRSRMWLVSRENIERCYPALDKHRQVLLARESLRETGKTITETTFAWTQPVDRLIALIHKVDGQPNVDAAVASGKGVIFVIPHLGNWEVINHFLGRHYGLTHMYQPNRNQQLNEFIQRQRDRTGTRFVRTDRTGIKAQLSELKNGGCIGAMPDQEPLIHTGEFAPFFGIEALTNELIARFSKTGAKLFIAVCERSATGFNIRFDPIDIDSKKIDCNKMDSDESALSTTRSSRLALINDAIENAVRQKPTQYLWSYKRFRTRPAGKLDFYQFNRHPIRTAVESWMLRLFSRIFRWVPSWLYRPLGYSLAWLPVIAAKRRKIARINLKQCKQPATRLRPSMATLFESALEAPGIWRASDKQFQQRIKSVEGALSTLRGSIILTPPLASREALVRFLGNRYFTTEYYHPNTITSLDQLIRQMRESQGIALVEHGNEGKTHLIKCLKNARTITLCPDQQPRLRGGLFVPFFNLPALTTLTLPSLLRETNAELVIGIAWREGGQYRVSLQTIDYNLADSDDEILGAVNQKLETAIQQNPVQYRWSDKRFNIRPIGQPKIYR